MNTQLVKLLPSDLLDRKFIGFNSLFDDVTATLNQQQSAQGYPPYNIMDVGESQVRIELAVAGFSPEEISVVVEDGVLSISGDREAPSEHSYSYRGISTRKFNRSFRLAEYWEVTEAKFLNGILSVELKQEIPEERKPKVIKIKT